MKRFVPQREQNGTGLPPMLEIYPNPSNGPVYVVYTIPEGVEKAELSVSDAQGRSILNTNVPPKNGIFELNDRSSSTGMHIVNLTCDGIPIGSAKVNIIR